MSSENKREDDKPRDMAGNDFIGWCAWFSALLFKDKFKRQPNMKHNPDNSKIKKCSADIYEVVMKHWRLWDKS